MDKDATKHLKEAADQAGQRVSELLRRINAALEYGPADPSRLIDPLGDKPHERERPGDRPHQGK